MISPNNNQDVSIQQCHCLEAQLLSSDFNFLLPQITCLIGVQKTCCVPLEEMKLEVFFFFLYILWNT